jgi:hypothetical protein
MLQPADDYFVIFLNSTHGVVNAISPRFTISPPPGNGGGGSGGDAPAENMPTVTVTETPNPTMQFAYTFSAQNLAFRRACPQSARLLATIALISGLEIIFLVI